jgi:hypothetical protein
MVPPVHGETGIMDMPEAWIHSGMSQEEILRYRMSLIRGKHRVAVTEISNPMVSRLQEIALSSGPVESDLIFSHAPTGMQLSDLHTAYGPSAPIERLMIEPGSWDRELGRVHDDTDLGAASAIIDLHQRGVPISRIQKALSVGTIGEGRRRRLVPTRWAITACDTTVADALLARVRQCPVIDTCRIFEYSSLYNRYKVLLVPTPWQYEWVEAFFHVIGQEEVIFADHEGHRPKKTYSTVGGCYYACKMAVLEALSRMQRQAGIVVLREAHHGYLPMGVFNVRENVRCALQGPPRVFECPEEALASLNGAFHLPISRFLAASTLFGDIIRGRHQTSLSSFTLC